MPRFRLPRHLDRVAIGSGVLAGITDLLLDSEPVRVLLMTAMTLAMVAALWWAYRTHRPAKGSGWLAFVRGMAIFGIGTAFQALSTLLPPPVPTIGSAVGAAALTISTPWAGGGLLRLLRSRSTRRSAEAIIDAALLATAGGYVGWAALVKPHLPVGTLVPGQLGTRLLFLATATAVFGLLLRRGLATRAGQPSVWYLLLGISIALVSEFLENASEAAAAFTSTDWSAPLGILCFAFLTAAALHPSMLHINAPTDAHRPIGLTPRRLLLLGSGLLVVPLVTLADLLAGKSNQSIETVVISVVMSGLVLWRIRVVEGGREQARAEVDRSEARFRTLVQNGHDVVAIVDQHGNALYVSTPVRRVLGHPPEHYVGRSLFEQVHPQDAAGLRTLLLSMGEHPTVAQQFKVRVTHPDGSLRWVELHVSDQREEPSIGGLVINLRDVSERKAFEEQLAFQAFHDPLTGLSNRALFEDRLNHALAHTARSGAAVAVLVVDLDNFKTVNDSLGHAAGDELLVGVAERLRACVRPSDTLTRLGGDEFAVVVEDAMDTAGIAVSERILRSLQSPFRIEGRDLLVSATIGVAVSNPGSREAEDLLRDADAAMYAAKKRGKGCYAVFEPLMHAAIVEHLELSADLRLAVAEGNLRLAFQPIVELASAEVVGVEALLRWPHPEKGLIPPSTFIPLAEESGLIVPLGRWVIEQACEQLRRWDEELPDRAPLHLAVNVAGRQLQDSNIVEDVSRALARTGIAPVRLILEITEAALMRDTDLVISRLSALRELGVRVAVDDFGTGYSSLGRLQHFPIDVLKIDKSFVDGVATEKDAPLTHAIVRLGRALDLLVVAEGIETAEQARALTDLGCPQGQGYHYSRPLDPDRVPVVVRRRSSSLETVRSNG